MADAVFTQTVPEAKWLDVWSAFTADVTWNDGNPEPTTPAEKKAWMDVHFVDVLKAEYRRGKTRLARAATVMDEGAIT